MNAEVCGTLGVTERVNVAALAGANPIRPVRIEPLLGGSQKTSRCWSSASSRAVSLSSADAHTAAVNITTAQVAATAIVQLIAACRAVTGWCAGRGPEKNHETR